MAEVFIATTPGDEARARGLAEALKALGYEVAAEAPPETELAASVEACKCVLALWAGAEPPASIAVLATLALDRKKLINAEISSDATPAIFRTAPRVALEPRNRTGFKDKMRALVEELDKFTTAKGNVDALPAALIAARAALLQEAPKPPNRQLRMLGVFASAVAVLFVIGFSTGRVINAVRAGDFHFSWPRIADDSATAAPTPSTAAATPTPTSFVPPNLETTPWRASAEQLAVNAEAIKQAADRGEARAQALACLGHLAGVEGFLPSPSAARAFCDSASASHDPAGLYFSWVLRRSAPHAGLGEPQARARLEESARLGWLSAIIDLGQTLSQERTAAAQSEAGRLFLSAAERDDARGQFLYARWLRDSPAGPRDPAAAVPFLEQAVAQEQPDALHMLATLYRDGIGVQANPALARTLYDRAARQNHPPSMFNLAEMLDDGPDRARAIALYRQLACMRDERQIQPMAVRRLAALRETATCG